MSPLNDFPADCITNSYILHDFAEIAYIVCTHATPPGSEKATELNSPDNVLLRLRNAEQQFRQASILVALDAEKLELFTFYKKVDVVKDQRTILSKFGLVCRLNSCIIARKSAARVLELLKPESARVYQLFTSAVLSSIQVCPRADGQSMTIGSRKYLVPVSTDVGGNKAIDLTSTRLWDLCRVGLQVITTGQVVLTIQKAQASAFQQLTPDLGEDESNFTTGRRFLYLAPTGQLARRKGTWSGHISVGGNTPYHDHVHLKMILSWLKKICPANSEPVIDQTWVEVEIPVFERQSDGSGSNTRSLVWKPLVWPMSLAFAFSSQPALSDAHTPTAMDSDPLRFVQEWYLTPSERYATVPEVRSSMDNGADQADDEILFNDEVHFEDTAHLFGPPVMPASQLIYPTPPEGALTHPTPGMSVEGMAPTPVYSIQAPHIPEDADPDQDMRDAQDMRPISRDRPMYDDDLFEEMPDDNFASGGVEDEPNWDFFDQTGLMTREGGAEQAKGRVAMASRPESLGLTIHADPSDPGQRQDRTAFTLGHGEKSDRESPKLHHSATTANDEVVVSLSPSYGIQKSSPLDEHKSRSVDHDQSVDPDIHSVLDRYGVSRRSSIFDSVSATSVGPEHDKKYEAHGKYWFDTHQPNFESGLLRNTSISARPPSSKSTSSVSSEATDATETRADKDAELNVFERPWTQYQAGPMSNEVSPIDENEVSLTDGDLPDLLKIIELSSGDEPFVFDLTRRPSSRKRVAYDEQKASMIAQILVDQVTQSCLFRENQTLQLQPRADLPEVDVIMGHGEAKQSFPNATLAEVTVFQSSSTATSTAPKVKPLRCPRVQVDRADVRIRATPSVLTFWDTLGLQPVHGQKDFTAFCLHPAGSNVSDGCANFLGRMADTYSSCNLGLQSIGRIAGLTNDGLLPWSMHSSNGPSLKQVCQRLGNALATSLDENTTAMIYMVSPSGELSCCREVCHAFTILFDAFSRGLQKLGKSIELALHILPVDFVASPETLAIPGQETYLNVAIEVYNRIPPSLETKQPPLSGSAVILDETQNGDPVFDLSSVVVNPLLKGGDCLHLAYAYSFDNSWISASWTDDKGLISLTMSYCLLARDSGMQARRTIIQDFWDISHDIMSKRRGQWRLAVARSGYYEDDELRDWLSLANQNNNERKSTARLMLFSINLDPVIILQAPTPSRALSTAATMTVPNATATPVSTPQNISTSPDQHGIAAAPTPSGVSHISAPTPPEQVFDSAIDNDVTLSDPAEESWSAMLAFGLNQSHDPLVIRPAAASGQLLRRKEDRANSNDVIAFEVHLVAMSRPVPSIPNTVDREAVLQDILEQYRRLVTLAATRGCISTDEFVPWHIATAVKGVKILGEVM